MSPSPEQPVQPFQGEDESGVPMAGAIGFWDVDQDRARLYGDEVFARLMGLEPQVVARGVALEVVRDSLRAEDRLAVMGMFSDPDYRAGSFNRRYGISQANGEVTWLTITRREPVAGREGNGFLSGVVVDVTPQTAAAQAMVGSELHFQALAEAVPQNVFSTDADGVHDFLNRRWFEFTGEPMGPVTPERWLDFLHEGDRKRTLSEWQASLDHGRPYDVEYRYLRHDGQYRWMRVMALPERDPEGRITRWFGTATDIHDSKQIEVEREVISGELSHRIKNLFSVFGGLISLSARSDERLGEFADAVQKRLSALAIAHDFIGFSAVQAEDRKSCSLHVLLGALGQPYCGGETAGQVTITGQDLQITKTAMTPMTLVTHELLTNAVKYGALSQTGGAIRIETRFDAQALYLDWHETWPVPREVAQNTGGFGSGMLTTVVERLLQGRLERTITTTGLEAQLVVPLDRVT